MNIQEIILKCQKLSRLSTSSNPNEAGLAASRLAELMVKYQIDSIDLDEYERLDDNNLNTVSSHLFYSSNRKSHWRMSIASGCSRLFNCIPYWFGADIKLIGRSDDVQLCKYLYESITKQIESLCSSEWNRYYLETCLLDDSEDEQGDYPAACTCGTGYDPECPWTGHNRPYTPTVEPLEHRRAWSASFLLSCSSVVKARLLEKHRAMMSSLPSTSLALTVFKDRYKDSLKYAQSLNWSKVKLNGPSSSSVNGYISGQASGSKVRIDKELTHNLPLLERKNMLDWDDIKEQVEDQLRIFRFDGSVSVKSIDIEGNRGSVEIDIVQEDERSATISISN